MNRRINRNCNLEDICSVIGYRSTRILAGWYAGRSINIPPTADENHPLVLLIGFPNLRRLVAAFPLTKMHIRSEADDRLVHRDRKCADACAAGMTVGQISLLLGVAERRVRQIRQALTENGLIDYAKLED